MKSHKCKVSSLQKVLNISQTLSEDVKAKLCHSYVSSRVSGSGDSVPVLLQPASGGHPVPVLYGPQKVNEIQPLTTQEVVTIGHKHRLSGNQVLGIMADLRAKEGASFVEPHLTTALISHHNRYKEFFTAEKVTFKDKENKDFGQYTFFCPKDKLIPFLQRIC